jgi:hypothetical protein
MSYKFTPQSEDEVQAASLCAEGLHPFTVLESDEVVSKSEKNAGKPLIKLKLNLHGDDGLDYHCYEYIGDWVMAYKFRHFFFAIGLGNAYEAGIINAAHNGLAGRSGWADVGIEKAKGNYRAKNVIRDFKPQLVDAVPPVPTTTETQENDDVPF